MVFLLNICFYCVSIVFFALLSTWKFQVVSSQQLYSWKMIAIKRTLLLTINAILWSLVSIETERGKLKIAEIMQVFAKESMFDQISFRTFSTVFCIIWFRIKSIYWYKNIALDRSIFSGSSFFFLSPWVSLVQCEIAFGQLKPFVKIPMWMLKWHKYRSNERQRKLKCESECNSIEMQVDFPPLKTDIYPCN